MKSSQVLTILMTTNPWEVVIDPGGSLHSLRSSILPFQSIIIEEFQRVGTLQSSDNL